MSFGARENTNGRGAVEALCLDVPSMFLEQTVTCCSETSSVCHLTACHKSKACLLGQPEKFFQPATDSLFDDGRRRCAGIESRVLLPCGREPVCCDSSGQRTANYPAEEPAAG